MEPTYAAHILSGYVLSVERIMSHWSIRVRVVVCVFRSFTRTLAFSTHCVPGGTNPHSYNLYLHDKHTDACTSCRRSLSTTKNVSYRCGTLCIPILSQIRQSYTVSRYTVWNILTHPARINRKFQGIGEFIAVRQERRLYYNDIINGFIVKCIIVTLFLSIACDRIFNKRR